MSKKQNRGEKLSSALVRGYCFNVESEAPLIKLDEDRPGLAMGWRGGSFLLSQ